MIEDIAGQMEGPPATIRASRDEWDDQQIIDQALSLVADYHAAVGTLLGLPISPPELGELRRGPLGHDLRTLVAAIESERDPQRIRAAVARVRDLLFRPLAADQAPIPVWFQESALGERLGAAERASYGAVEFLSIEAVAAEIGATRAMVADWVETGAMVAVSDGDGRSVVPRPVVDRWRSVGAAFANKTHRGTSGLAAVDRVLCVEHRAAS